ncbi:MAG: nitrilase-related carbon-nitrogen hydrolase [Chloroflexia bacterium]
MGVERPLRFLRLAGGLFLALLSGVLLFLALPPSPWGFLGWIALVPALCAQFLLAPDDRAARFYGALAYILGLGIAVWRGIPASLLPAPVPLHLLIAGALLLVGTALYLAGFPSGSPSFHRRTGYRLLVIGPAMAWVGLEFLRQVLHLGHIWGWLVTTQRAWQSLWRAVGACGPWGVSLLVVAANYALALGVIACLSPQGRASARRPAVVSLVALGLLFMGVLAWSIQDPGTSLATVRVAAIQPGAELGDVHRYVALWLQRDWAGLARAVVPDLAVLTGRAAAQGARLIVWPEAALWLDPRTDPWTREQLLALAREAGAFLVVPYFILPLEAPLAWWLDFAPGQRNEIAVVTPDGRFLGPSAKSHPSPFLGEVSSTRGQNPVHTLPFARLGSMQGYDSAFPDVARRLARQGAQLLTVSSHDWAEMSEAHGVQACLRAAENRVALVKADWEVGSLICDPWGRLLAAAPFDRATEAIVIADVPLLPAGGTPYTRSGDVLAHICLLGGIAFLSAGYLTGRRLLPRGTVR